MANKKTALAAKPAELRRSTRNHNKRPLDSKAKEDLPKQPPVKRKRRQTKSKPEISSAPSPEVEETITADVAEGEDEEPESEDDYQEEVSNDKFEPPTRDSSDDELEPLPPKLDLRVVTPPVQDTETSDPEDTSVVELPIDVETGSRLKGFTHQSDGSFTVFKYEVADILECRIGDLKMGYLTPDMKAPTGRKLYPRSLDTLEEYDEMIGNAVKFLQAQRQVDNNNKDELDNKAGGTSGEKGKGRGRKPSRPSKPGRPPNPKPPVRYVITVVPELPDAKAKNGKTGSKSTNAGAGATDADFDAVLMEQGDRKLVSAWRALKEARYCANSCKTSCIIIRSSEDAEPAHHKLTPRELRVWAQKLAEGEPNVTNNMPPSELELGDVVFKNQKSKSTAAGVPAKQPAIQVEPEAAIPVPPQPLAGAAPHVQPAPPPPPHHYPYHYPNAYGMPPPNPYPPPGNYYPPQPSPAQETVTIPVDFPTPLLSEWLAHCDSGSRGKDGHKYLALLPAFEEQGIVRLLDFQRLDLLEITKLGAKCNRVEYVHYGTACRLHAYAKDDVRRAFQRVRAGDAGDSGWPGFKTVHECYVAD